MTSILIIKFSIAFRWYFGSSDREPVTFNENAHGKASLTNKLRNARPERTFGLNVKYSRRVIRNLLTTNAWARFLEQSVKINGTKRRVAPRDRFTHRDEFAELGLLVLTRRGVATLTAVNTWGLHDRNFKP